MTAAWRQGVEELKAMLQDRRTLRIAVDMWRRIAGANEAEVKRLRAAIAAHRRRVVIDPQPWDKDLWRVLDDEPRTD